MAYKDFSLVPNNNGNTPRSMIDDLMNIGNDARQLSEKVDHLNYSALHGRNYQTVGDDRLQYEDREQVRQISRNLQQLATFMYEQALRIHRMDRK